MIAFLISLLIEARATHEKPEPFRLAVNAPARTRFCVRHPVDWGICCGALPTTG
jgi:hypothetical protein